MFKQAYLTCRSIFDDLSQFQMKTNEIDKWYIYVFLSQNCWYLIIWIVTFYSKKDFEIIASSTSFYSYFINASKIQINFFLKERQEIIWQLNILATRPFGMGHSMSHVTETVLEMMRISSCRVLSPNFSWLKGPLFVDQS